MVEHQRNRRPPSRRILTIILAIITLIVPPVFALDPRQLVENIGAWISLMSLAFYVWLVVVLSAGTGGTLVAKRICTRVRSRPRIEYLVPEVSDGVELVARAIEKRVRHILDSMVDDEEQDNRPHVLRLVVITGLYTLNYLDNIVRTYPGRHRRWIIRMLILDPDAGEVGLLSEGTRATILAGLDRLAAMRATAAAEEWPIALEWRCYRSPPALWGYLFDEGHLLFGWIEWSHIDVDDPRMVAPRMRTQHRKLAHVTRHDELGRDTIDSFRSRFDYLWKFASREYVPRDLEKTV